MAGVSLVEETEAGRKQCGAFGGSCALASREQGGELGSAESAA